MRPQLAVLADYANVAAGDKLNVMGVFDTITSPTFPVVLPSIVLALRLRLSYEDGERTHDIAISLKDEDGHEYLKATAKLAVGKIPPGEVQHQNQVLNFAQAGFTKPGKYVFEILCDGTETRVDLNVVQAPQPSEPPST